METKRKSSRKEAKSYYIQKIIHSESYEEALTYKIQMGQDGLPINKKVYYELLQKCIDKNIALKLKSEMENRNIDMTEEVYVALIKKKFDFDQKLNLLEEMENKGLSPTLKTYYSLIKYETNFHKALFFFNRMKLKKVGPDAKVYQEIVKKALGSNEYKALYKEKEEYETRERLSKELESVKDFASIKEELISTGQILNLDFVNHLLNRLHNNVGRIQLINACLNEEVDLNHFTYWNFLIKSAKDGLYEENKELLNKVKKCLVEDELHHLTKMFMQHVSILGGKGKLFIQKTKLVKAAYEAAVNATDTESFYYLLGKSIGLDENGIKTSEEDNLDIEEDRELFKYEEIISRGVLEGNQLQQNLKEEWLRKRMPILVLTLIEDDPTLSVFRNYSITKGFYPYELHEINKLELTGCYFTNSIVEMEKVVKLVDFTKYDVAINFFIEGGSKQFYEQPSETVYLLTFIEEKRGMDFIHLNFIQLNKEYRIPSVFHSLYNSLNLKGGALKERKGKGRIDELDGDDD